MAVKEPYSEQALRDVQRAAGAAAAAPTAPPSEPAPPVAVPPVAAPPMVVANADPRPATGAVDDEEKVDWVWPAKGKVVTGFSEAASLKGIDIAGTAGQPVTAGASGKVVYAGTGLRGYGKLIIVKHNGTYLSAYAHNKDILVKEGQQVTKGQKIAEMGNTDAEQVKLHFEIRRHGKPMDPLRYLPPA
jgi:lipoprotein NlpD